MKNFPQFVVIHTVKGFSIVHEAEVDVFLEFSCFFYDPLDVGNLISGSSAFSKSSLNIWKFSVHILLKPHLENFEYYFANMWNECNCAVVWTFLGLVSQLVKNLPAMWETWIWFLGWEDPLEKRRLSSPVFWRGEFHGLYPWGRKQSDTTERLSLSLWTFFVIALLWDWNENWYFTALWPLLSFTNLLASWVQHFHSIIFWDLK